MYIHIRVCIQIHSPSRDYVNAYEVSSIKNANLSIKYEGIKLQKWLIARKKGINVVVPRTHGHQTVM